MMNEKGIRKYIRELKDIYQGIQSIWLIGSRANNIAKENSDWDLLAFANKNIFYSLQENIQFNKSNIDLLIVDENGKFKDPWGKKEGDISSWRWTQKSDDLAYYRSAKFIPDAAESKRGEFELGEFKEEWLQALKLL